MAFNRPTKVDIIQFFQDRFRLCGEDLSGASERLMRRRRPENALGRTMKIRARFMCKHIQKPLRRITDPRVAKMLDDSVSCGRSMRWFCRVWQR